MQIAQFTCPLPPSVNEYLGKRVAYNPITKKPFVQVYETAKAKAYKKHMLILLERVKKEYTWQKTGELTYVICTVDVYLNQKRKDSDNLFKCLLDSLTQSEMIYDDSMVIPRVGKVFIDSENPRLEVELRESDKKGIFPNYQYQLAFEKENCEKCTRFSRNCSIRKEALQNKLRPEIKRLNLIDYSCDALRLKKGYK